MKSKKFLFVSKESLSGALALQLIREEHQIKFCFSNKKDRDVYNGFFEKVDDWKEHIHWADIIVFDEETYDTEPERLRRAGKLVIGGTRYTKKLETDRFFGQEQLAKFGIPTLPCAKFKDYDAAMDFIRKNPSRYVFKPTGDKQTGEKSLIVVGEKNNGSDLIEFLAKNKNIYSKKAPEFILQKFEEGVEVAVGAFFNGKKYIYPINVNFEHKRFFYGNLGPMTGEAGTMMYWDSPKNVIFKKTLEKFKSKLAEVGYVGYIDLNCIVNERGIHPLEFTCRFGYPTIQIQLEAIRDELGDWLYALASGKNFRLSVKDGYQIGVVIFTPPALSESNDNETVKLYRDLAILFKNNTTKKGIHIGDVKTDADGIWRVAGTSGWNLIVTGNGKTVQQARETAQRRVDQITIPDMFYRKDIGKRWLWDRKKMHDLGYL